MRSRGWGWSELWGRGGRPRCCVPSMPGGTGPYDEPPGRPKEAPLLNRREEYCLRPQLEEGRRHEYVLLGRESNIVAVISVVYQVFLRRGTRDDDERPHPEAVRADARRQGGPFRVPVDGDRNRCRIAVARHQDSDLPSVRGVGAARLVNVADKCSWNTVDLCCESPIPLPHDLRPDGDPVRFRWGAEGIDRMRCLWVLDETTVAWRECRRSSNSE
jgi:hypothetical protein